MIKAAVFDLDHTLFDRYETLKKIVPFFKDRFKIAEGITDEFIYENLSWADKNFVHIGWTKIFAHLCSKGIFAEIPEYEEYESFVISKFKEIAVKYPFAIPTINELKAMGLKIGLITNSESEVQNRKLAMLDLTDAFDYVIISGDTPYRKPDKEIFLMMTDYLGIKPEEMMFIGDHPKFDVDGSRKAGCIPVWVKTTGTWTFPEIEKPELQIETVKEIPQLIKEINER